MSVDLLSEQGAPVIWTFGTLYKDRLIEAEMSKI
jgi:hypothetical protein